MIVMIKSTCSVERPFISHALEKPVEPFFASFLDIPCCKHELLTPDQ